MRSLVDFWNRIPLKAMLALTIACLLVREQYPFSNFPMFGSFVGQTYYLYLADQSGKPLPALAFSVPTNGIKKFYDGRLRKLKKASRKGEKLASMDDRAVAEETLRYLISRRNKRPPELTTIQLVRVDISVANNQIMKKKRITAEIPIRE